MRVSLIYWPMAGLQSSVKGLPVYSLSHVSVTVSLLTLLCVPSLSLFRDKAKTKSATFVANGRLVPALSPQRKGECLDDCCKA